MHQPDARVPGLHQQCLPHQQLTASLFPDHPLQTLLELRTEILRIEGIQAAIHKSERIGRLTTAATSRERILPSTTRTVRDRSSLICSRHALAK